MPKNVPVIISGDNSWPKKRIKEAIRGSFNFEKVWNTGETIAAAGLTVFNTPVGRRLVVDLLDVTTDCPMTIPMAVQISNGANNTATTVNNGIGIRAATAVWLDWRRNINDSMPMLWDSTAQLELWDKQTLSVATRTPRKAIVVPADTAYSVQTSIQYMMYDLFYDEPFDDVALGVGDSIMDYGNGGTSVYYADQMFFTFIWQYYTKFHQVGNTVYAPINLRPVNKGAGGTQSLQFASWVRDSWYNIAAKPRIIVWNHGMNDGGSAGMLNGTQYNALTSTELNRYTTNLTAFITLMQARYPKVPILICSPSPASEPTLETNLALLRTINYNTVKALSEASQIREGSALTVPVAQSVSVMTPRGQVLVSNMGTAFTATTLSFYSDNPGIHPNATTGHPALNVVNKNILDNWLPVLPPVN
jgi:hypothetical protein